MFETAGILFEYMKAQMLMRSFSNRAELTAWQERKFEKFKKSVLRKSKFYADYANKSLDEFPIVDKKTMLASFDSMNTKGVSLEHALEVATKAEINRDFSPSINGVTVGLSSGTSGRRGVFLVSHQERIKWAGIMLAKALPRSILKKHTVAFFLRANSNLYTTLKHGDHIKFDFYDLTSPIEKQINRLNESYPEILVAPASTLRQLAIWKREGKVLINPIRIFSVAEVLEDDDAFLIEDAFDVRPFQIYQATEGFLGISSAKANGRIVLNEEYIHVEREWVDRTSGRFIPIITDFSRSTQPIVRYRLDDVLVEDREFDLPFTVLKKVEGRCDDTCYLAGEHPIAVNPDTIRQAIVTYAMHYLDYQIIQTEPGVFDVRISNMPGFDCKPGFERAFSELSRRYNAPPAKVTFSPYEKRKLDQKFRRIIRES